MKTVREPLGMLHHVAVFTLLVFVASGCTKAVDVPRERFEAASRDPSKTHRVRMESNAEYVVRHFSLTDSTLVIHELSPADANYRLSLVPIRLPLADVQSVERVESNNVLPVVVIGGIFVMLALIDAAFGSGGFF
jgi:hypothetical protein